VQDARQAIRFVRAHADNWDIDPGKVGIGGFSAGGHLSLNSVLSKDSAEQLVIPGDTLYKYPYKPDFLMLIYPGLGRLKLEPEQFSEGFPPVFMINAMDDDVTPVSDMFNLTEILKSKKIPAEIHVYPGGGHGFDLGNKDCNCTGWPDLFRNWLMYNNLINK
jgi:acetyl esterase/lipase